MGSNWVKHKNWQLKWNRYDESSLKSSSKGSPKDLNSTQQKIVELIQENPKITQAEMAEIITLSKRAIQKNIKELVDADIIEREGSARKSYWKIKE